VRISAIIPSYNRADLIGETLRSVLSQTRAPDEVIVVDDGSTDASCDVISEQFGSAVKLIRQANAGGGAARNTGLACSTGDIIHFQDSDDLSSLNTYEVQGALIEAGADVAYGPWLKTRFEGRKLIPEGVAIQQGPIPPGRPLDVHTLMVSWITVFQPCLFRRSVLERAGAFRCDISVGEDMELMYRISRLTDRFVHSNETILLYRLHPENQISEQHLGKRLRDRANAWSLFKSYLDERSDVGAWHRALFNVKKLEVVKQVRAFDAECAARLEAGSNMLHHLARPLHSLFLRASGRFRVMRYGHGYGRFHAAAPLTGNQRRQIALLGYVLPDGPAASDILNETDQRKVVV
jgi:glycosyltransferase involved in cell wall biosynthesis